MAGDDAMWTEHCTEADFVDKKTKTCAGVANRLYAGKAYQERACCKVGTDAPSDECPVDPDAGGGCPTGVIIGVVVLVLLVVVGAVVVILAFFGREIARRIWRKLYSYFFDSPFSVWQAGSFPLNTREIDCRAQKDGRTTSSSG